MIEPIDPVEALREAFETIEPGPRARAQWAQRVGRAMARRGGRGREDQRWRLFGWSALAAAAMLAVALVLDGAETAPDAGGGRAIVSAGDRPTGDGAMAGETGNREALALAEVLMNDHSIQQLLSLELPSPDEIDFGVREVLDNLAGAILRPITRLGAQLEAG